MFLRTIGQKWHAPLFDCARLHESSKTNRSAAYAAILRSLANCKYGITNCILWLHVAVWMRHGYQDTLLFTVEQCKCTVAGPLLSILKCVNSHPTVFLWQAQERAQRTVIFSKTKTLSISRLDSAWTFSRDSRQLWPLLPPRMCKFHILGACTKGVWILAHFGVTQMHCTVKTFFIILL